MSQEAPLDVCAYCGEVSETITRDHVLPKALWLKGNAPKSPAMAPACEVCHKKWDRDVTYFRDWLVLMSNPDDHPLLKELAVGPVGRSLKRDLRRRQEILQASPQWRTERGIVTELGFRAPFALPRFETSVEKIVRGLYFAKTNKPLPRTHEVVIYQGNGFWDEPGFGDTLAELSPWQGVGDDVFVCRAGRYANDTARTAWLLVFYKSVAIYAQTELVTSSTA